MSKRILIVVVAVVATFLASGFVGVTNSEGFRGGGFWHRNIPINWRVSGTIVGLQLAPPTGDPGPGFMIDAFLKGAPGRAQFRVLASGGENPVVLIDRCGPGPGQYFAFDDMVITFEDLSMLFAKQDPDNPGWNCFTPEPAVANMVIIGGTGKYEGAGGYYQGIFYGTTVGISGALIAETGTIVGEIVMP